MGKRSIGVAVIGAGMAGRAHAAGYRMASTLYETDLPDVRLVAIADKHEPFAIDAARRYGYERAETDWREIVDDPDIDAVSIVVANSLHREIAEALLAAGKHVLCEKPMAPSVADAQAMVDAADKSDRVAAMGFSYRRVPAINAVRQQIEDGGLGRVAHFDGHYWCDYAADPDLPLSWRYLGGPGSGVLADIGSHAVDLGEYFCGPVRSVRGTVLSTVIKDRPVPLGAVLGHTGGVQVSDQREPVENEDLAAFTLEFANGATGSFSLSRVAVGHANSMGFKAFCENGSASYEFDHPAEFGLADRASGPAAGGYRQVPIGPLHPDFAGSMPTTASGVGYGQNDLFVYQARAFLEQVAGFDRLAPCPSFAHGLHNLRVLDAIVEASNGKDVIL